LLLNQIHDHTTRMLRLRANVKLVLLMLAYVYMYVAGMRYVMCVGIRFITGNVCVPTGGRSVFLRLVALLFVQTYTYCMFGEL
jgi:hypothetical protein